MDPQAVIAALLATAAELDGQTADVDTQDETREKLDDLIGWLDRGGFAPTVLSGVPSADSDHVLMARVMLADMLANYTDNGAETHLLFTEAASRFGEAATENTAEYFTVHHYSGAEIAQTAICHYPRLREIMDGKHAL